MFALPRPQRNNGNVVTADGNKLTIAFEMQARRKMVEGFVERVLAAANSENSRLVIAPAPGI